MFRKYQFNFEILGDDCKYTKIIHVNCSLRDELESDLRSNEHYLTGSENKA